MKASEIVVFVLYLIFMLSIGVYSVSYTHLTLPTT